MANFTFKTPTSIGHISGLTEKQVKELVQANQDQDDDNDDLELGHDEENMVFPTGVEEAMNEAEKIHDKHTSPGADDINEFDDALYPVEVSEHLKMKDADVLKRDIEHSHELETGDKEGMFPIGVEE